MFIGDGSQGSISERQGEEEEDEAREGFGQRRRFEQMTPSVEEEERPD